MSREAWKVSTVAMKPEVNVSSNRMEASKMSLTEFRDQRKSNNRRCRRILDVLTLRGARVPRWGARGLAACRAPAAAGVGVGQLSRGPPPRSTSHPPSSKHSSITFSSSNHNSSKSVLSSNSKRSRNTRILRNCPLRPTRRSKKSLFSPTSKNAPLSVTLTSISTISKKTGKLSRRGSRKRTTPGTAVLSTDLVRGSTTLKRRTMRSVGISGKGHIRKNRRRRAAGVELAVVAAAAGVEGAGVGAAGRAGVRAGASRQQVPQGTSTT
ncbi:uncharacterized protein [Prorops nasuta]|uniref:uncharacterized protein n=1 Tax=Prorops nasuta TaxID=863751 RepID=UPI0034CFCDA1